ncbi:flagellar biosynthesis/type III secretory pathway M-ring protein FliF/YscJ [Rhodopirellula rubra]|uniref:Flagellar biosynthesis/type III secretory pathway M-ring protein FliF/YscJ n=1 Tax=Aporhodopirellula rubra TaxID=980271 RepID=A0A7W5E2M5_9BACT|nr:flagellar biosynthesis/type III secretory pathway M-ring protein FliF/YscJ [Aporhodopirellula rubra]
MHAASLRDVLQAASLRWVLWVVALVVVALVVVAGWQPALRGVGELVAFCQRV